MDWFRPRGLACASDLVTDRLCGVRRLVCLVTYLQWPDTECISARKLPFFEMCLCCTGALSGIGEMLPSLRWTEESEP